MIAVISYGLLFPLAIAGAVLLLRKFKKLNFARMFLAVWFVVNTLLLYSPFSWQRRFSQGYQVVLAILTVITLAHIIDWLKSKNSKKINARILLSPVGAVFLFTIFFTFSNIVNIGRDLTYYTLRFLSKPAFKYSFYYPKKSVEAMQWLKNNSLENEVTLVPGISATFFPAYAVRPIYLGHGHETAFFEQKLAQLAVFYASSTSKTDRLNFLKQNNIKYVFAPRFENLSQSLEQIANSLELKKIFDNGEVEIYNTFDPPL